MSTLRDAFDRQGYVVLRSAVADPLLGFLWRYVVERAGHGGLRMDDPDVPGAACAYGDPIMEHMLERMRPSVEEVSGTPVYPTYSYLRLYTRGDALHPHVDRPACEISLSLNLGQEPPTPWPLWVRGPQGPYAAALEPGDALLYRGTEREHWREAYDGARLGQVFLHYVRQSGPHAEWKFDKRAGLALTTPLPL